MYFVAEYELVATGKGIKSCIDRIEIGDWGQKEPQIKLQRCANEVRDDSRCGDSFIFRASKGRCFCEKAGASCAREDDPEKNEYRLKNGEYRSETLYGDGQKTHVLIE